MAAIAASWVARNTAKRRSFYAFPRRVRAAPLSTLSIASGFNLIQNLLAECAISLGALPFGSYGLTARRLLSRFSAHGFCLQSPI
jgi:hypothetical protein